MDLRDDLWIAAPVERVWELTIDVERWPELTPTITSVERLDEGPLAVGSSARIRQPLQRPATWTVTRLEAPHLFEWSTTTAGVTLVGRHELRPEADGCRNLLVVELHGRGSGLLRRLVGRRVHAAIVTENLGFQRAAEQVTA